MIDKAEDNNNGQENKEIPTFQPTYFWAFAALMLYKLGGMEAISQEMLDKFDIDNCPEVVYDHDRKFWIMRLKKGDMPTIIKVPKKIMRRTPKILRN